MHRRRTELESKLMELGYELDHKNYTGRHSEKTLNYVYEKVFVDEYEREVDHKVIVSTYCSYVVLSNKRDKIEDTLIELKGGKYDEFMLIFRLKRLHEVQKEIIDKLKPHEEEELSVEEEVEVAECVGNSDEIC